MDSFAQKLSELLTGTTAELEVARTDGRLPMVERTKYRNAPAWKEYGKAASGGGEEFQISAWDEDARNAVIEASLDARAELLEQCVADAIEGLRVSEKRALDVIRRAVWAWAEMAEESGFGVQPMGLVVEACDELRGKHRPNPSLRTEPAG